MPHTPLSAITPQPRCRGRLRKHDTGNDLVPFPGEETAIPSIEGQAGPRAAATYFRAIVIIRRLSPVSGTPSSS